MSEDTDSVESDHDEAGAADGHDDHADEAHDDHGSDHSDDEHADRVTSPMQSFETSQVAFGAVVGAIGMIVTIVLPLLLV